MSGESAAASMDSVLGASHAITLHGLGFLQVQLEANQRLHVWHPDLPRRRCFAHSSVHDHRFSFKSLILRGVQVNSNFNWNDAKNAGAATHVRYLHEGARTKFGNRPWTPDGEGILTFASTAIVKAGTTYEMYAYAYHSTTPAGNGKVATLMTKDYEGDNGAHSTCVIGIEPDADFDRLQWPVGRLWEIVADVLSQPLPAAPKTGGME